MRQLLLTLVALAHLSTASLQERFIAPEYQDYFHWFNDHSPTTKLYEKGSQLYVFNDQTILYSKPTLDSEPLSTLNIGTTITNIGYGVTENNWPEDQIDGYDDIWFHVKANQVEGYIWGANIAKAWLDLNLKDQQEKSVIMLGVPNIPRTVPEEIYGTVKIISKEGLLSSINLKDFCVFEECQTSNMIRLHKKMDETGDPLIEVASMTVGCEVYFERSLLIYNIEEKAFEEIYKIDSTSEIANIVEK